LFRMTVANSATQSEDVDALWTRMTQRQGIISGLILDRNTGAILRSSGLLSKDNQQTSASLSASQSGSNAVQNGDSSTNLGGGVEKGRLADDYAAMVFSFVKSAEGLVKGLDEDDEARLLRLRTKKHELVIYPGEFLHETHRMYSS
jgi:dynein light chain roadblock-type